MSSAIYFMNYLIGNNQNYWYRVECASVYLCVHLLKQYVLGRPPPQSLLLQGTSDSWTKQGCDATCFQSEILCSAVVGLRNTRALSAISAVQSLLAGGKARPSMICCTCPYLCSYMAALAPPQGAKEAVFSSKCSVIPCAVQPPLPTKGTCFIDQLSSRNQFWCPYWFSDSHLFSYWRGQCQRSLKT